MIPANASARHIDDPMTVRLDPRGARTPATDGEPFESMRGLYDDGKVETGVWECTPGSFPASKEGVSELAYVLEGDATLTGSDGVSCEIRPGTFVLTPDGWAGEWHIRRTVRKIFFVWRTVDGQPGEQQG